MTMLMKMMTMRMGMRIRILPIDICPYCGANVVPGCLHVLRDCSAFADVRELPAPECPLAKAPGMGPAWFLEPRTFAPDGPNTAAGSAEALARAAPAAVTRPSIGVPMHTRFVRWQHGARAIYRMNMDEQDVDGDDVA